METGETFHRHEALAVPEASEVTHADYHQAVLEQEQLESQKREAANMLDSFAREVADLDKQIATQHARLIEIELLVGSDAAGQDVAALQDEKKSLEETLTSLNDRYTRATSRFETSRAAYEKKFGAGSYDTRVIN